jgi:GDP/UDP-N,N'-diacetylbacillosamine 2-epimerase (hydrolysing)
MRKICFITGTRAEYGLLQRLMRGIKDDSELSLQIIATGMHLSPEFGITYQEIEQDGFHVDQKVEMLMSSDTSVGVTKSMGLGLIGFADALNQLQPDIVVVLGDRFEIFVAVSACLVARIPVAHLHGGEVTEGAIDDALRHSITKMSHLHFVAAEEYWRRVIQLGETPENVFMVGGLGVDNVKYTQLLGRTELESDLGLRFNKKNLLITFHPATLDNSSASMQMKELLTSLADLADTQLIFTMPNADAESRGIVNLINEFVSLHENAYSFKSLGQLRYLSCLAQVDAVVGNSSSGLTEAPSFKKGTINIGDRQKGRLEANSVINCEPNANEITKALNHLYSEDFQDSLSQASSPYGEGGASQKILSILKNIDLNGLLKKSFYDFPTPFLKGLK